MSAEIMVSTPRQEERQAHSGCLCVYLVETVSAEYAEVPRAAVEQCWRSPLQSSAVSEGLRGK